jgi:hypothetical protein
MDTFSGETLQHWTVSSKVKLSPVTGREMLRIAQCLDIRLTDGIEVVSPTHRPRSTLQKHYFYASGIHLLEAE